MKPKSVRIDPGLDPDLAAAVRRAEPVLERVLGDWAARVDVVWEPGEGEPDGDRSVRLTVTDAEISRSDEFLDWEFREDLHVRWKLRDLREALLAERIRVQLRRLQESLAGAEG